MNVPEAFESESLRPVLTASAMRSADTYTIESYGIPSNTLMETAGRAVVSSVASHFGPVGGRRIVILCGRGNNGGDGYVAARGFYAAGASVTVVTLAGTDEHSTDAGRNLRILLNLKQFDDAGRLEIIQLQDPSRVHDLVADLYVDALLGTGLTRELRPPIRGLVEWLNGLQAPVVSVDVPTGLHTDRGTVLGAAVCADLTVTMGAPKTGLLLGAGPDHAGRVEVAEIGIPAHALSNAAQEPGCAWLTTDEAVLRALPPRTTAAHKYSVGLALVVGGSPGLAGAPVMASSGAARIGAGAVVCACHEGVQPILAGKLTDVMTLGLPGTEQAGIDPEKAMDTLAARLRQARAALIGCGLGRAPSTIEFVRRFCSQVELPLVIDADGLNALSGHEELLRNHAGGRWILTPHEGEFERLTGVANLEDRVEAARSWANRWNAVLVLKGIPSLVSTPAGIVYICGTGNPALATAGTGDILAGLCVGLLAQGLSAEQAAVSAVHIGGAVADLYVTRRSERSMLATDILDFLPRLLRTRFENPRPQESNRRF